MTTADRLILNNLQRVFVYCLEKEINLRRASDKDKCCGRCMKNRHVGIAHCPNCDLEELNAAYEEFCKTRSYPGLEIISRDLEKFKDYFNCIMFYMTCDHHAAA